jgi:hypothetical protein
MIGMGLSIAQAAVRGVSPPEQSYALVGVTQVGSTYSKSAATGFANGTLHSTQPLTSPCEIVFQLPLAPPGKDEITVGFDTAAAPSGGTAYADIDFGAYTFGNVLYDITAGTFGAGRATNAADATLTLRYEGTTMSFLVDGVAQPFTLTVPAGLSVYLMVAFYHQDTAITITKFGAV